MKKDYGFQIEPYVIERLRGELMVKKKEKKGVPGHTGKGGGTGRTGRGGCKKPSGNRKGKR